MAALLPAFHGFHLQQPLSRQSGACRETAHQAGNMFSHQGTRERANGGAPPSCWHGEVLRESKVPSIGHSTACSLTVLCWTPGNIIDDK
ncbi:uncharacterized protein CCOS01_00563 [Colletotrichum costaricense]|uniref:Uncharacterized protein n=1 Tax=Colletotrichum costaricense TaxID=1209916 RepID=A0AAI9Z9U3_9PEZI|nr:uncharacterized protein CCOS01_00563 [Colletotrichum costaricense]KAK1539249.1 hypothetical protein CCOS01_00563 [Colletotrichum costaricense]